MEDALRNFYKDNLLDWFPPLSSFLESSDMENIRKNIVESRKNFNVFPEAKNMFRAFSLTPLRELRVVILGQDPYHTKGFATGLAFSSGKEYEFPPSLQNILNEIEQDVYRGFYFNKPYNYDLSYWARQGILLLNTSLTVIEGKPGSHSQIWKPFTEYLFKEVLSKETGIIYLLWGNHAKKFKQYINSNNNYILEAAHPSPLSAHNGFFGCKHFSKVNEILESNNGEDFKIIW